MLPASAVRAYVAFSLLIAGGCEGSQDPEERDGGGLGAPIAPCEALPDGVLSPEHVLRDFESLDRLTRLPVDRYRTQLASSYDRAAVSPSAPGWFANADANGSEGTSMGERVLLDTDGPGVITRVWSANPSARIKFFFDGATTPQIDATLTDLLEHGETISGASTNARIGSSPTLFTALVYAQHVKVTSTVTPGAPLFFAIDHRAYEDGITVRTTLDASNETSRCVRDTAHARIAGTLPDASAPATFAFDLAPGVPRIVDAPVGGGRITSLRVSGIPELPEDATLRVAFDGETTIEAPVRRLFLFDENGIAARGRGLRTDPEAGTAELAFPMPFAQTATFTFDSADPAAVLRVSVVDEPATFTETSLFFHAHWTGPQEFDAFDRYDLDVVDVAGRGFYVGTAVRVHNPSPSWWGEGDEKIWVDDESFPSHFGTGTEDYFGYAYCDTKRFAQAYFGQTRANFSNFAGVIELYRLHVVDAIPFDTRLDFDLEVAHWDATVAHTVVNYDATSYFYSRRGAIVSDVFHVGDPQSVAPLPEGIIETSGNSVTCR